MRTFRCPSLPLLQLAVLFAAAWALPAFADVRRCVTPEGGEVYTDRACPEVGGTEQAARPAPAAVGNQGKRAGCARDLQDLMHEMTGAFDARDANRLAGVYHWAGMSGSTAYDVLARLDDMVQRPLLEIVPVMEGEAATDEAPPPADRAFEPAAALSATPEATAPPPRRTPVALRVEQTLANGVTPSHTIFGLQKYFGCWWIKD